MFFHSLKFDNAKVHPDFTRRRAEIEDVFLKYNVSEIANDCFW
jgi:hypothetical protein